ncbi:MAG: NfeD family protein [Sphingomonas bacterium]|nr:NfeD family protein [Sphingomonas bacterium]
MSLDPFGGAGGAWIIAALVLGIAELVIPGVFLIFLAIAAAITGLASIVLPDLTPAAQIASFAVWSAVTVLIGRRWYRDYPVDTTDALLNDRAGRLVGKVVSVEIALTGGSGRVRIGDGSWLAHGADAPVGARVRVVAVQDGFVDVEQLEAEAGPDR